MNNVTEVAMTGILVKRMVFLVFQTHMETNGKKFVLAQMEAYFF